MGLGQRYIGALARRSIAIVLAFFVATVFFAWQLRHLELRSDFKDLLPEGRASVVALNKIIERAGGMGMLIVGVETENLPAAKRFTEDLVRAIRTDLPGEIQQIDYTANPLRNYFREHGILFLSLAELEDLDRTLAQSIRQAKLASNPFYLDVEDSKDTRSEAERRFEKLEKKWRGRINSSHRFPDGYYVGENGRLLAIFLRPSGSALDVNTARSLLERMQAVVDKLNPTSYHPSLRVGFTGNVQATVEEHGVIAKDLVNTSVLVILLVGAVVWFYFRLWWVLGVLGIILTGGALWAFGATALIYGYVNAQTAFLGSVIVGTGINYGIFLLARYVEERRKGLHSEDALTIALRATMKATGGAAIATAFAFGCLMIAEIRSFSQFGFVGGLGILLCWILTYTVLPAMVLLLEKLPWVQLKVAVRERRYWVYPGWLARGPVRHAPLIVTVTVALLVVSFVAFIHFLPQAMETDTNNLRSKQRRYSGAGILDARVSELRGESINPAVMLADSPDQARRICRAFEALREKHASRPPIEWCRSIWTLIPEDQEQKLAIIGRLRERLDDTPQGLLPDTVQERIAEFRKELDVKPITLPDIPDELRALFRGKDRSEGTIVVVAAGNKLNLRNVNDLYYYVDAMREVRLDNGEVVHASGDNVIFADILRSIAIDAPRTTLLSLAGMILILVLMYRRPRPVVHVGLALFAGVGSMLGLAALFRVKYNFLNFVAVPTTFGIGVDYPMNIYQRYALDGPGSLETTLRHTGPAVITTSLTTIVGYAVLLVSDSMVLASFGKLAILGEVTCLIAALLVLPAVCALSERKMNLADALPQPPSQTPQATGQ